MLAALYRALHEPIDPAALARLSRNDRVQLYWNARTRRAADGDGEQMDGIIRKIDFLGKKTQFLGLRPAGLFEVPLGKRMGEVFVAEVGSVSE